VAGASEPSRLSAMASTPAEESRRTAAGVKSGVALGATATGKPRARAKPIREKRTLASAYRRCNTRSSLGAGVCSRSCLLT
jgi:hypothetical protein